MEKLRAKVAELRGELESFSSGVTGRLQPVRTEVNALAGKVEAALAGLGSEIGTIQALAGTIDSLDAELAKLEP
ncbi:MAG TPA: hypothetical protein VIG99_06050 [Myxococcaceae bacterium]|jgi:hypothetical protein